MQRLIYYVFFQLFVYASGAQSILSYGAASSFTGRALCSGAGLTLAVYTGFNASGTYFHLLLSFLCVLFLLENILSKQFYSPESQE